MSGMDQEWTRNGLGMILEKFTNSEFPGMNQDSLRIHRKYMA
jgi:hypothetical protein